VHTSPTFASTSAPLTRPRPRIRATRQQLRRSWSACGYAADYGETAAIEEHAGQKWISAREDRLLRLVMGFFEERIFGPLRIERLEMQLRANAREQRKEGKLVGTRIRKQIAELDRKIRAQIQALEKGFEPELVGERISELRGEKEALEGALGEIGAEREEAEAEELSEQLARVPDLTKALREAHPHVQRQVFEAFELQVLYDKAAGRIEISATVSEAVANAFEKQKALPKEGSLVVLRDIAGARYLLRGAWSAARAAALHVRSGDRGHGPDRAGPAGVPTLACGGRGKKLG
jgi:hypothetical protein